MGWNIKKWLGLDNSTDTSQERYEAREQEKRDREAIQDQLAAERKAGQQRQANFDQRTNELTSFISDIQIRQQEQNNSFASQFQAQSDQFAAQNSALQQQMADQAAAAAAQAAALQREIEIQRAEALEQKRIATNLGRASVPDAQAGATGPATTEGSIDGGRKKKDNELSELSIVSNAQASPLSKAGLQIA